jgi:hypothetical protein
MVISLEEKTSFGILMGFKFSQFTPTGQVGISSFDHSLLPAFLAIQIYRWLLHSYLSLKEKTLTKIVSGFYDCYIGSGSEKCPRLRCNLQRSIPVYNF